MRKNRNRIQKIIKACAQALEHLQYLYHGEKRQIKTDDFLTKNKSLTNLHMKGLGIRSRYFPFYGNNKRKRRRELHAKQTKRKRSKLK